ncbi:FAD-binding domain-containing family protein [Dorcoceras hygrometricum]|uniref:FAD-binding domain-containing family protein n=1 Tax=Dorcoceras hygrometricum TaxID=472368 RepID=A0A2Z7AU13_9LAMI|nr:FAD-binding domain-containing family protein [Dorcoceras hygrometricum]
MSLHSSRRYIESFNYIYTPSSPSYPNLRQSFQQNPRWLNSTSSRPEFIVTPYSEAEIRAAVICCKKYDLQIRVKSGGHDYEGLSFLCQVPFIIIDLTNLRSISVDLEDETAWVDSGATVGELYYTIAKNSDVLGFPAGICPSVGIGGHFSGGGIGTMLRKHGLAADNIIDAYFIDVDGRILDREAMGEDLFWAIRGGGGASFGIVVAWKIKLVRVPPVVTVFTLHKNLDQECIQLVNIWQNVSSKLPRELFIRLVFQNSNRDDNGDQGMVEVLFNSLFLGPVKELIPLMEKSFPELGLDSKDCSEMSWIESTLYLQGFKSGDPLEVLLDRTVQDKSYFKAKSDFVEEPIPEYVWEALRGRISEERIGILILDPLGGRMDEIPESELPFPHRKGNLYNIQYLVKWTVDGADESERHVNWIRSLYDYMEPYVARSPRSAYLNYRDLDIGINKPGDVDYSQAAVWGSRYFKGNFEMLAEVKSRIDPGNFFTSEQSIPPLNHPGKNQLEHNSLRFDI